MKQIKEILSYWYINRRSKIYLYLKDEILFTEFKKPAAESLLEITDIVVHKEDDDCDYYLTTEKIKTNKYWVLVIEKIEDQCAFGKFSSDEDIESIKDDFYKTNWREIW